MTAILGHKHESFALLESPCSSVRTKRASRNSSCDQEHRVPSVNVDCGPPHEVADKLNVHLSIRTGRMIICALAIAAVLLPVVAVLLGGRTIATYEHGLDDKDRKSTLDRYNSASGSVTSAFQFPIKLVSALLLSVIILTFGKRFVMVSSPSYETRLGVMLASFVMAYLLTSGLSAVSVKLENKTPVVYMNASDLVTPSVLADARATAPSGYNHTWNENTTNNSITNTVLRTAVRPFKIRPAPMCFGDDESFIPSPVTATFGFRMATWQSSVFERALDDDFDANNLFKIYMNKTKDKEMAATRPKELPMDLKAANDLLINSLMFTYSWVKWWNKGISLPEYMENVFTNKFGKRSDEEIQMNPKNLTATEAFDLAAPTGVDPVDHFINRTRSLLHESLAPHVTASYIASSVRFKSIKLSQDVTMDSVTYDVPMWKGYLNRKLVQNGTRLMSQGLGVGDIKGMTNRTDEWEEEQEARTVIYELDKRVDCGPLGPVCLVESNELSDGATGDKMTPEHRIRAIGECMNADGTNEIKFTEYKGPLLAKNGEVMLQRMPSCASTSKNSFFISGFSYRIKGDAIIDGAPPGVDADEDANVTRHRAYMPNPRKVYTFTVARISWKPTKLSDRFHVQCDGEGVCDGLSFPLNTLPGAKKQHLVVSEKRLPAYQLAPYDYSEPFYHEQVVSGVPLVATPIMLNVIGTVFADYAMSHNFKKIVWDNSTLKGYNCSRYAEKVLVTNIDNHFYMEGSAQPVYTTAFFFLFQQAEVREEIQHHQSDVMLATENVVVPVNVNVSIPDKNAVVTIVGSFALLLASIGVWIHTKRNPDSLQQALPANTTVRVLMNDDMYPSFLLKKTVMSSDQGRVIGEGNDVTIDRVGLRGHAKAPPV